MTYTLHGQYVIICAYVFNVGKAQQLFEQVNREVVDDEVVDIEITFLNAKNNLS